MVHSDDSANNVNVKVWMSLAMYARITHADFQVKLHHYTIAHMGLHGSFLSP